MQKIIQFVARCIDAGTGELIEESIMQEEKVEKALTLKERFCRKVKLNGLFRQFVIK